MQKRINTVARFAIALLFIVSGLTDMIDSAQPGMAARGILPASPEVLAVLGSLELVTGTFLFLRFRVNFFAALAIILTIVSTLLPAPELQPAIKNLAVVGGLILLINNDAGESLIEYLYTDPEHLPDYKTRL